MKKYITILSIATVFLSRSCERSDPSYLPSGEQNKEESVQNRGASSTTILTPETPTTSFTPGGDDEPDKDKQHWRSNGGDGQ